jgi:hypothetical protein
MTRDAIQRHYTNSHRSGVQLYRVPATGPDIHPRLARLHVLTGPVDHGDMTTIVTSRLLATAL